jgi:hypothetical protein
VDPEITFSREAAYQCYAPLQRAQWSDTLGLPGILKHMGCDKPLCNLSWLMLDGDDAVCWGELPIVTVTIGRRRLTCALPVRNSGQRNKKHTAASK